MENFLYAISGFVVGAIGCFIAAVLYRRSRGSDSTGRMEQLKDGLRDTGEAISGAREGLEGIDQGLTELDNTVREGRSSSERIRETLERIDKANGL